MNISSAVLNVLPEHSGGVIEAVKSSDLCDFHLYENGNVVITLEGETTGQEMEKLKQIEKIPHVIASRLIYSYSEEELDAERARLCGEADLPDWLNDDKIKAESIKYSGDLRKKM